MRHLRRTVTDGTIPLRTVPLFGLFLSRSRAVTALALSVDRALSLVHPIAAMDVTLVIYELCSPPGEIGLTVVVALIIWVAARNGRSALTFGVVVARTDCAATLRKCWLIARVHPPLRLPTPFSQATGCVVPERLRRIRRVDRDGARVPHPPQCQANHCGRLPSYRDDPGGRRGYRLGGVHPPARRLEPVRDPADPSIAGGYAR